MPSAVEVRGDLLYFDNAATTRVRPEAAEAALAAMLDGYGNPSSRHRLGSQAHEALNRARRSVAELIAAEPDEIIFTSGATEANNSAIWGAARARARQGRHVVASAIEHPSVLEALDALEREGFEVTRVPPDPDGVVTDQRVAQALRPDTILVSVMLVNNEVGSLMPVQAIARAVRSRSPHALVHSDLVQAAGRVLVDVRRLDVDLASLSAHKLHGPKGAGALFVRRGVRIEALLVGGGQERGLRSGTENVPGIVAFGVAAHLAARELPEATGRLQRLTELLWEGLHQAFPRARRLGPADPERRAPHILAVAFEGLRAEVVANHLDEARILVSMGSACASHSQRVSHVLSAMGVAPELARSMVRFSLGLLTTEAEVRRALAAAAPVLQDLAAFVRREPIHHGA